MSERHRSEDDLIEAITSWIETWSIDVRDNEPVYDLMWRVRRALDHPHLMGDIGDFHEKFGLPGHSRPTILTNDVMSFRVGFLEEELEELAEAHKAGNIVEIADALVDLTYVTLGTAYLAGIPFDECWRVVHESNMRKVRAESVSDSKRGSVHDVVKPEGWTPPDLKSVLYPPRRTDGERG